MSSLTGRIAFTKHAAATLQLLGTVAAVVAVFLVVDDSVS